MPGSMHSGRGTGKTFVTGCRALPGLAEQAGPGYIAADPRSPSMHVLDLVQARGLVQQVTDSDGLKQAMDAGPVVFYGRLRPDC